jgi:hypothetical protein
MGEDTYEQIQDAFLVQCRGSQSGLTSLIIFSAVFFGFALVSGFMSSLRVSSSTQMGPSVFLWPA